MTPFPLPVGPAVLASISSYYKQQANEFLLLVPHGSTLYGTHTPESDVDLVAIFLPTLLQISLVEPADLPKTRFNRETGEFIDKDTCLPSDCNTVEVTPLSFPQLISGIIQGLPLQVEIFQYLLAWHKEGLLSTWEARSYNKQLELLRFLKSLGDEMGQINPYPMLSFGLKNVKFIIDRSERLKTYLDIQGWVEEQKRKTIRPPCKIDVADLLEKVVSPGLTQIDNDVVLYGKKIDRLTLGDLSGYIKAKVAAYGPRTILANKTGVDFKSGAHALRCFMQVQELLSTGGIQFPLKNAALLIKVKKGEIPQEDVHKLLQEWSGIQPPLSQEKELVARIESAKIRAFQFVSHNTLALYRRLLESKS